MTKVDEDKLKSWNNGSIKNSIVDFLRSTVEDGSDYIKPEDRIATLIMTVHFELNDPYLYRPISCSVVLKNQLNKILH
jgi:hypothetical protein